MSDSDYVTVRRRSGSIFRVLAEDLVSGPPDGYDLSLMRNITLDGLETPITVRPISDGRFVVLDGRKRLAAIRMLVKINKGVYDKLRGIVRPAKQVFALLRCRLRPCPAGVTAALPPGEITPP